ncbi:MAG: HAMP domain-containing sensor histidine kinase [Porticoccus sp.]
MATNSENKYGGMLPVKSLRLNDKGNLFITVLLVYVVVVAVYMMSQKSALLEEFSAYEQLVHQESVLVKADLAVFDTIISLFVIVDNRNRAEILESVHEHFGILQGKYFGLSELFPERAESFKALLGHLAQAVMLPSTSNLQELKSHLTDNKRELESLLEVTRQRRDQAVNNYYQHSDRVALITLLAGLAGLVLLGGVTTVFFHRITNHIKLLRGRVAKIMGGYRGEPLIILRTDELGQLVEGVNAMAAELVKRESELELANYKNRYQEKMSTIEHLAAGLVHEIGNPAAAIIGLSQELLENCQSDDKTSVEQIKHYSERLQFLGEDLAKLAIPQQKDYCLISINELVQSACSHTRFDERWQSVVLTLDTATDLPAIYGYGDQLLLVLLHLLSNAFDALTVKGQTSRSICIVTSKLHDKKVMISVEDTGCGMDEATRLRSFAPFYTTKQSARGNGLGLPLCQSVILAHGGEIVLSSELGTGTKVTIILPQTFSEERDVKDPV